MGVVLVNGNGNPAVYAAQDSDLLGGISGQETGILDINDKFAATIADANTVEISSGVCITKEGRRIQIDVGDVEEVIVPTGSQGTTKYYIIGFHLYTDGSGNQLAETFIDEVASPSATITEKMFKDGETEVYVSLYRITRNGLNLEGLTLILPEIGSLAGGGIIGNTDISGIADGTLTGAVSQLNTDLSVLESKFEWKLVNSVTGSAEISMPQSFNEIMVVIRLNNNEAAYTVIIPSNEIHSTDVKWRGGYYTSASSYCGYILLVNLARVKLKEINGSNGGQSISNTVVTVYYR